MPINFSVYLVFHVYLENINETNRKVKGKTEKKLTDVQEKNDNNLILNFKLIKCEFF